jgi:hypothetical protein
MLMSAVSGGLVLSSLDSTSGTGKCSWCQGRDSAGRAPLSAASLESVEHAPAFRSCNLSLGTAGVGGTECRLCLLACLFLGPVLQPQLVTSLTGDPHASMVSLSTAGRVTRASAQLD